MSPTGLIAYSEATRYTAVKRLEAEAWCRAHGQRLGRHVLYPRTKGFIACVQTLRQTKHITAILDVTVAYAKDGKLFQLPPSFAETVMLPDLDNRWRFFVHVDRHAISELPHTSEGLAQWLEDRWVKKGERLEKMRQLLADGEEWTADIFDAPHVQKSQDNVLNDAQDVTAGHRS
ncbi:hypothetical protein LTR78_004706 [Recurvomyces mirabilis]|uniref:Acyltransferase C-terminal domain-containing protein n=1 Tax=Recurvomyces mirabilis TaxID=574656 RepID=A0AAE1C2F2_9PEZI|nr:hypothetical protein LTR78_004706 [Recurvomyces mirabilis]KAK5152800.1 hypothetical protein LTS14_007907 [Recurvomyces mirabilis]